jgi:hypothetical protein
MDPRLQLFAVFGSAGLLLIVLEMVRRRRLHERYALLWLCSAGFLLLLSIWDGLLEQVAELFGIAEAPNALFFLAFATGIVVLLHFSAAVSRLSDQSKILAQRLSLLEERLRHHEQDAAAGDEAFDEADAERTALRR